MRGEGVLKFFAEIHPAGDLKRSRSIAEALELDTRRHVGLMSTGMRQKLALAVVMSPQTPLLILDEPTANLDPSVRATVLELVSEAHRSGRTVMFSSHVLSEIEETCNRVAFLRGGVLAHELRDVGPVSTPPRLGRVPGGRRPAGKSVGRSLRPFSASRSRSPKCTGTRVRARFRSGSTLRATCPRCCRGSDHSVLRRIRIEPLGLRAVYDSVHDDSVPVVATDSRPAEAPV